MEMPPGLAPQLTPAWTNCPTLAEQARQERRGCVPDDQPEAIVLPAEWQLATLAS